MAISNNGGSAILGKESVAESATDGGDDVVSVGDVVLKKTSLNGVPMELWIPESFVAMDIELPAFVRGDINQDSLVDVADAIVLVTHLYSGGSGPLCDDSSDCNDDGALDIADAITLLEFLFMAGSPLPFPDQKCGIDPTADGLDCQIFPQCNPADPPAPPGPGDGFYYSGDDFTIVYDPATGEGEGETTIYLEEGQENISEPTPIQALDFVLDDGPLLLPTNSITLGPDLIALNGGSGPDFFAMSIQDGVLIVQFLTSINGSDALLLAAGPVEMFQVGYSTDPASLMGNTVGGESPLTWTTFGAPTIMENNVLPVGATDGVVPTLNNFTVTLEPLP